MVRWQSQYKELRAAYPGIFQFAVRGILLAFLFILVQFASLPFVENIIVPEEFYTVQYIALSGSLLFSVVIFLIISKDRLTEFPKPAATLVQACLFAVLGFAFHFAFFFAKWWIAQNPFAALSLMPLVIFLRYAFLAGSVISFALAVFGIGFARKLITRYRIELAITAGVTTLITAFAYAMQNSWQLLSLIITTAEYHLLSLFFSNVKLYDFDTLGIGSFVVNVGKVCSGVESILLFTALYSLIFFLDRGKLRTGRMLLIFIPGLIGVFVANILRIFLILVLGVLINPEFAVGIFHTNAGWMLFILYFFVFWYFAYPWVRK